MPRGLLIAAILAVAAPSAAADVDYMRDVKPLLRAKCSACHGALRQKSKLRLDAGPLIHKGGRDGPAVIPGKPDESPLIEAVLGRDRPRMPPEGEGEALTEKEVNLLRDWIAAGAKVPDEPTPPDPRAHWAYQPVRRPVVPGPAAGTTNPIDAFLNVERAKHGLTANPPADRNTLLRRVYLDLVGFPPTPAEIDAFLADTAPDAYEKVVDRLLASPHHGERWGRHWMDVWRYSDPFGYGEEYRYSQRHVWRWRDWIVESLNADKGYDRMVVEMLAGDEVAPADPDTLRATGYLARNWYKFNRNVWVQDAAEYTAAGFLGVTLKCARCHDHKYDPLSQADYYRFRAVFEPHDVRTDLVPGQPDPVKDGVARVFDGKPTAPTYLFLRGDERTPDKSRVMSPGVPPVLGGELVVRPVEFGRADHARALPAAALHARRLAEAERQAAGGPSAWAAVGSAAAAIGRQREVAEAHRAAVEARVAADEAKYAEPFDQAGWDALARTAAQAERRLAVLRAELAVTAAERAVAVAKVAPAGTQKKTLPAAEQKLTAAKKTREAAVAAAGKDDPKYTPVVKLDPTTSTGRRLALAKWIADPKNPLTARVAVNHVWMRHLGTPLVGSVANFGVSGQKPTHPELLDWLAAEFVESGWSMKKLHRLIVTSAAYKLSSRGDGSNQTADPENRLHWRANPRRMEAEAVRDSLLAVSGRLDPTVGGPVLDEKLGLTSPRRSIYFRFNAQYRMAFLDQFDPASPTECYERKVSVIPQQGLTLMNSSLALNTARLVAKQLADGSPAPSAFVTAAYERVIGRPPTAEERGRCEQFLREQAAVYREPGKLTPFPPAGGVVTPPAADPGQRAREDLVLVLFNHNDFVTVR